LGYLKTYIARLQAVTAHDVQAVAKKFLDPQKRAVVHSTPAKPDKGAKEPTGRAAHKTPARYAARSPKDTPKTGGPAAKLERAKRVVLPNGLTLLLLENRRLPILFAEAYVGRVRLNEPAGKAGVAALVGQLLEEGTENRSEEQIAQAIEETG